MDFSDDFSLVRFMDNSFTYFFLSTLPISRNVLIIFVYIECDGHIHFEKDFGKFEQLFLDTGELHYNKIISIFFCFE